MIKQEVITATTIDDFTPEQREEFIRDTERVLESIHHLQAAGDHDFDALEEKLRRLLVEVKHSGTA